MCGVPLTVNDTGADVCKPASEFSVGDKVWACIQVHDEDHVGTKVRATIKNTNHFENNSERESIRLTVDDTGEDFYTNKVDANETLELLSIGEETTDVPGYNIGDKVLLVVEDSSAKGGTRVTMGTVENNFHQEPKHVEKSVQIRAGNVLYHTVHSDASKTLALISPVQETAADAKADPTSKTAGNFTENEHVLALVEDTSGELTWKPSIITNVRHKEKDLEDKECIQLQVLNSGEMVFTELADANETLRHTISNHELMTADAKQVENKALLKDEVDGTCKSELDTNPTFYIEQSPQMFFTPAYVSLAQLIA
jgi:hypothetical protein